MKRSRGKARGLNPSTSYWVAWIFGTVLIVLSWFRVVPPLIGWAGFFIAVLATLFSVIYGIYLGRKTVTESQSDLARPEEVTFTEDLIQIKLADGRVIAAPLDWYPKLAQASPGERAECELDTNGIYWPGLQVDVSVWDILDGVKPAQH